MPAAAACARPASMSATTMLAPARASAPARARPMPPPPPVHPLVETASHETLVAPAQHLVRPELLVIERGDQRSLELLEAGVAVEPEPDDRERRWRVLAISARVPARRGRAGAHDREVGHPVWVVGAQLHRDPAAARVADRDHAVDPEMVEQLQIVLGDVLRRIADAGQHLRLAVAR